MSLKGLEPQHQAPWEDAAWPPTQDASLGLWERSGLARLQLRKPVGHPLPSVPESS